MDYRKYLSTAILVMFVGIFATFAVKHLEDVQPMLDQSSHLSSWADWAKKPFLMNLDLIDWFMVVVLTTTVSFFWIKILENHLSVEIMEAL